jgi:hypothetical protein
MKTALGLLAAAVAPALAMLAWYACGSFTAPLANDGYIWARIANFATICFVVSAAHVAVLGVPAFLLLRWRNAIVWWSATLSGFILGAMPTAALTWPLRYPELHTPTTIDGVQTMINGTPTIAGWLHFASGLGFMGFLGAVGGKSFWLVWRT